MKQRNIKVNIHIALTFVNIYFKILSGDIMLFSYKEIKNKLKSDYQIKKAIEDNSIYKIDDGLYSDKKVVNPLEVISKKYPDAIFTLQTAFYLYDLTDVIPDIFYLATARNVTRIKDKNIKQVFVSNNLFSFGKTQIEVENIKVNIYDKERLLIELIRKKNVLPFDYYKEIIHNFRKEADNLDMFKIQEYISYYKNEVSLYNSLMQEVF